jgi:hypothetical protein
MRVVHSGYTADEEFILGSSIGLVWRTDGGIEVAGQQVVLA